MTAGTRIRRALGAAVIASSLATPLAARAASAPALPALPDLGAALAGAGLSAGQISQIEAELSQLQALPPGGTLPAGALDGVDSVLPTFGAGMISSLFGLLSTLESSINPAAPVDISSILSQLQAIIPEAGGAASGALAELQAALQSAGLGQTLTQVPGLGAGVISTLLSQLASLERLQPGAPVGGGAIDALAVVLAQLASAPGVPAQTADALQALAAALRSGAPIRASQLLALARALARDAASVPSGLSAVCSALAAQLQSAGSLLGGLASIGEPLSASQISALLSALDGLSSLPAGASAPVTLLAPVAQALKAIAAAPGVPAAASQTLRLIAGEMTSGAASPRKLAGAVGTLRSAAASLPSPLDSTLSGLTAKLARAGSLRARSAGHGASTTSATRSGPLRIVSLHDAGGQLVVALRCRTRGRRRCLEKITIAEGHRRLGSRTVDLRAGAHRLLRLLGAPLHGIGSRGGRIRLRVTVASGSHRSSRTFEVNAVP